MREWNQQYFGSDVNASMRPRQICRGNKTAFDLEPCFRSFNEAPADLPGNTTPDSRCISARFNEAPADLPGKYALQAAWFSASALRFNEAPADLPGKLVTTCSGIELQFTPGFNEAPADLPGNAM